MRILKIKLSFRIFQSTTNELFIISGFTRTNIKRNGFLSMVFIIGNNVKTWKIIIICKDKWISDFFFFFNQKYMHEKMVPIIQCIFQWLNFSLFEIFSDDQKVIICVFFIIPSNNLCLFYFLINSFLTFLGKWLSIFLGKLTTD